MQHMMAEERIIGRWCEIGLPQHRHYPARLSTRGAADVDAGDGSARPTITS